MLPALKPLPMKDRVSMIFIQYGQIDVLDGAFVVIDQTGIRTHIPVGSVACIMLEPGTRVSHAAVHLASTVGTLLVWVGEAGVRLYASGQPGGARADRLLYQAKLALDDDLRLKVVRKMYELRFQEPPPEHRSIEQLRGIEGVRVRETYKLLAHQYSQPLFVCCHQLSIRHHRGSGVGSRLCSSGRIHSYGQAVVFCLRHCGLIQI
jgi:CRISPR-associated protein Cas1